MQGLAVDAVVLGVLGHELVIVLGLVQLVKPVELNQFDEPVGILRIGGIASSLESTCPSFVVGGLE